jgi:putative transposase
MLACDFFVSVTVHFRMIYVFVIMEVGSRRLLHFNVTSHPTAAWTLQQFREVMDNEQDYRFVIHDRDKIYSQELDLAVRAMGVRILKTSFRSPQAKDYASHCTSLIPCGATLVTSRRWDSLMPCAFCGGFTPGGS